MAAAARRSGPRWSRSSSRGLPRHAVRRRRARGARRAGDGGRAAPPDPRRAGDPGPVRLLPGRRGVPATAVERGVAIPAAYAAAHRRAPSEIERAPRRAPLLPLPQRPARRQLHRRRRAGSGSSTGSTRAWATRSSTSATSPPTTSSTRTASARCSRRTARRDVRRAARHAVHVRLPRGDVGRRPAGRSPELDFDFAGVRRASTSSGRSREDERAGGGDRRRRRRLLDPLLADQARLGRRRARRAGRPDERLDVPLGRARRPAARARSR